MKRTITLLLLCSLILGFSEALVSAEGPSLASVEESGLRVVLNQLSPAKFELVLKPAKSIQKTNPDFTVNVFAVENPLRIVADIPKFVSKSPKAAAVSSTFITSLRLGVHADKTRIVLDLGAGSVPQYGVRPDKERGALVVDISFAEEAAPPQKVEPAATAAPADENIDEDFNQWEAAKAKKEREVEKAAEKGKSESEPATLKQSAAGELPKEQIEPQPQQTAGIDDEAAQKLQAQQKEAAEQTAQMREPDQPQPRTTTGLVKGIYYQAAKINELGSVMIDAEGVTRYSLKQPEANKYELTIFDCSLAGAYLTLPQFPPDTFAGFQLIVAAPQGNSVLLKIYTEEDIKLSPYMAQGRLWVKAAKN